MPTLHFLPTIEFSSLIEIERKILQYNRIDKDTPVEQRKPIKLFIYSYGGELDAMFSFIDVVALSKTPVWTINHKETVPVNAKHIYCWF